MHTSIARTLKHDIIQFSVGLGMEFVKNDSVGIKAVLIRHIRRQSFVLAPRRNVLHFLLRSLYIHLVCKHGTPLDHCESNVKDDLCLVAVSGTAVHLRSRLKVRTEEVQRNGGGKLGLALLLGDLDIGGIKLSVAVGLQNTEDISDDLFLPVDQLERLTVPRSLGMTAELLNEAHRMIGGILVIVTVLRHKAGRLIMFQFSYHRQKNSRHPDGCDFLYYEQQPRRAVRLFV